MLLSIEVPHGLGPGDTMLVAAPDGNEYQVVVPKGCFAGSPIDVDLPCEASLNETTELEVVVPEGVHEGETFSIETAWGETFDIACPAGCAPGHTVFVEVPQLADQMAVERPLSPEPQQPAPESTYGRRRDRGARASRESRRSREARASTEATPAQPSETHDDYGHRYRPGAHVQVLRTSGSYSRGRVLCSFEGVFDTLYQVRLDSGQVKQAVPEHEMFSADDADDTNFADHFQAQMQAMFEQELLDASFDDCPIRDDDY
jgi:hypothetical protein